MGNLIASLDMLRKIFLSILSFSLCSSALGAVTPALFEKFYFNLGNHFEFYNAVQNDSKGGLRTWDFAPVIGVGRKFPIGGDFNLYPEFNWVLPQSAEDTHIITNTLMYRLDLGYSFSENFNLRFGTSIMQLNQHGRGGESTQRNGTSTSTFYYPDENRSSINNTLDFGGEILIEQFAIRPQVFAYSIFREDRRQFSYALFFTYYLGNLP